MVIFEIDKCSIVHGDYMTDLTFKPLIMDCWEDFEELFGEKGACQGCWCMYFRITSKEFNKNTGKGNKLALKTLVKSGGMPGILAFQNGKAVGWCSFGPRTDFVRLKTSRYCKAIDEEPVWSIVCFFIHKSHRKQGISQALLHAAIDYIKKQKVKIIEAYAISPKAGKKPSNIDAYVGPEAIYKKAGFKVVARHAEHRPIMRYFVED